MPRNPASILAASAGVFAAACLFAQLGADGLVRHLDWHVHLCWLQGFHDGLTQGAWYPRWIDVANEGQGGPVFLYYAPLAYYLGAGFVALGAHVATALEWVYLVSLLVCTGGLFAWLRPVVGRAGAVAFAAFGLLTPQLTLFAYSYNMPASALAVGLLPWVAWAIERHGTAMRRVAALGAVLALLLMSHTLTGFQTLLLLALAGGVALFDARARGEVLRVLLPATLLALALASVYLLPLLLSRDLIHAEHLIESPQWRIGSNLQFGWLFGGAQAGQGAFEFDIANGLALLACAVAVWRIRQRPDQARRRAWWPFALVALLTFPLMTPLSAWLYAAVEPLRYLQFGWRWQALFLLCVLRVVAEAVRCEAVAAAPAPGTAAPGRWRSRVAAMALSLCGLGLVACMLRIVPPMFDGSGPDRSHDRVGLAEASRFAQRCAWPMLEYRPRTMGAAWRRELARWPQRPQIVSGRAHVVSADIGNQVKRYAIVADLRSRVVLPVLAFPGWTLRVDAVQMPVRTAPDDGRILLDLERGRHEVELRFEPPAAAHVGAAVSLAALLVWMMLLWRGRSPPPPPPPLPG